MDSPTPATPDLLTVARRQWPLILVAILVAAAAAFGVSRAQEKKYTASASLGFDMSGPLSNLLGQSSSASADVQEREAATIAELVSARNVADRTARAVHRSSASVASAIDVQARGVSNIVTVSATDHDPGFAARLANTYARQYIALRQQSDIRDAQSALTAIRAQLKRLSPQQRQGSAGRLLRARADQLSAVAPLDQGSIALATAAHVPSSPSSPKTKLNVLLGGLVGLLLGLALAVVRERSGRRVVGPGEQSEALGLPLLGALPYSRSLGPDSESVQALSAKLQHFDFGRDLHTVLLTSSGPGEGTSTVAWHLATTMATNGGRRVLLVEADMANPVLAERAKLPGGPGLAQVLEGGAGLDDAVRSVPGANGTSGLHLLPAGELGAERAGVPYRLLESPRMREVLSEAAGRYDLVLIDTAPLGTSVDAIPLVRQVDGVLVVSRAGHETKDSAAGLAQQLDGLGAPVLGLVANGARSGRVASAQAAGAGHGRGRVMVFSLVVLALVVAGLLIIAPWDGSSGSSDTRSSIVKSAAGVSTSSRANAGLPSCARVTPAPGGRTTCRTRGATLTIAQGDQPVVLPGLEARVMRAAVVPDQLLLRVRLRNASKQPHAFNSDHRQVYLSVNGQRLYAVAAQPPVNLSAGEGRTDTLRFAWTGAARQSRRVDVGLVPWSERGRDTPRRLGIIRVQLGQPG